VNNILKALALFIFFFLLVPASHAQSSSSSSASSEYTATGAFLGSEILPTALIACSHWTGSGDTICDSWSFELYGPFVDFYRYSLMKQVFVAWLLFSLSFVAAASSLVVVRFFSRFFRLV